MLKKCICLFAINLVMRVPDTYGNRFLVDTVDTTHQTGKGKLNMLEQFTGLKFSGYIQPQIQIASRKGSESYNGGNFPEFSKSRLMLRRARLRMDYKHYNKEKDAIAHFVIQFDGSERSMKIRDLWASFYENKLKLFSISTGLFARPFGFEVNYPSPDRESPERGRMSQILMKAERDVGAMLSINDRNKGSKYKNLQFDIGVFNGQGLTGPNDYDDHKDLVARAYIKPTKVPILNQIQLSGGISGYLGGITSQSEEVYSTEDTPEGAIFVKDISSENSGKVLPRKYAGADIQIQIPNRYGSSQIRAEYIYGTQTGTLHSSETPGTYPMTHGIVDPLAVRNFDGVYLTYLQHLGSPKHQAIIKYDWYDPNTEVTGMAISEAKGFNKADIRYNTLGVGYVYYANPSLNLSLYYDIVKNEKTALSGFTEDIEDNIFTCRIRYRF
jgi:hypothetical protein